MKTLDEVITAMDGADFSCTGCALQYNCDECECILTDAFRYLKEYRERLERDKMRTLVDALRIVRGEK